MNKYKRIGKCNHCGLCCFLVSEGNMTGWRWDQPRRYGCRFLKKKDISKYHNVRELDENIEYICEIKKLVKEDKLKIGKYVRDHKTGELISVTKEQYEYWKRECYPYPDPNDDAHWNLNISDRCGYRRIWRVS